MVVEVIDDLVLNVPGELADLKDTLDVILRKLEPGFTSGDLRVCDLHLLHQCLISGKCAHQAGLLIHISVLSCSKVLSATTDDRSNTRMAAGKCHDQPDAV